MMIPQFPHYRVARRQQAKTETCTWLSLLTMPSITFCIGLILGLVIGKCRTHHK